jgi:site-specific recombinase XerD
MSIHIDDRGDRRRYKVRWRQGGKLRSRSFAKLADARAFDAEIKRLQASGDIDVVTRGAVLLRDYVWQWWDRYAKPNLTDATLENYALQIDKRIIPTLGDFRVREVTPARIEEWIVQRRRAGDGTPTIGKALTVLQAIFRQAEVDDIVARNPVAVARKPRQSRERNPAPITPATVEAIRRHMLAAGRLRDATLVSVLAYSGLRPESEAVTLTWSQVRDRTILVRDTKRHTTRTVRLLAPLAQDLREWRMASGRPGERALVFPAGTGGPWKGHDWDNWRDRVYRPAAIAAKLPPDTIPRDLRGSFASLLIAEGQNPLEVARQLGHSARMCLERYAQVFEEHDPAHRVMAEDAIAAARAAGTTAATRTLGGGK